MSSSSTGRSGSVEPERGQRVFARHVDLLDPGPVGPAAGLQQPRGRAGADEEVEGNLAVAQGVEELPGGELPVGADLEVPRADPAQVHPGIGVRAGIVDPRRRRLQEGFLPPLEIFGLRCRRVTQLRPMNRRAQRPPRRCPPAPGIPVARPRRLRPALPRTPALPRHDWFPPASSRCRRISPHRDRSPHHNRRRHLGGSSGGIVGPELHASAVVGEAGRCAMTSESVVSAASRAIQPGSASPARRA